MLATKRKPENSSEEEFESARAALSAASHRAQELELNHQALCAAKALTTAQSWELEADRLGWASRLVAAAFPNGPPPPKKLPALIEAAEEAAQEFRPTIAAAKERFDLAARAETDRIALALQPKQKAAIAAMASAVEDLSRAIEAERAVRAELAQTAPERESRFLPDFSSALQIGSLTDFGGRANRWAAAVRQLKVLT